ncbi:MAG TPA: TetR family transcriptional regulator [Kineosporiaceae bacterium]
MDIVDGAFEYCRTTPVEELSMPRLAAHLGVGVTSIYWYFKSKRELIEAMTDQALRSFYAGMAPIEGSRWDDKLRNFFNNLYELLRADELTCDLISRRVSAQVTEGALRAWPRAEELLETLVEAGFSQGMARHAFVTLSAYTQGILLVERTGVSAASSGEEAVPSSEEFSFGINNIIGGLALLLPRERGEDAVA